MKCGEFDIRNKNFEKAYSSQKYFNALLYGPDEIENYNSGKGKVLFDVGSHKGESATFFSDIFPEIKIFSFEPNKTSFLEHKKLNLENNILNNIALSNFNGLSDFFEQDISHLSSLIKVNNESESSLGYAATEQHKKIEVTVNTGDFYIKQNNINKIDLLKMDVQSNEVSTLQGFSDSLSIIRNVMVEISLYDLYEISSSIGDVEELLSDFKLYDVHEISKNPKTLGTDWVNLVYKNTNYLA